MSTPFIYRRRVQFSDTDLAGIAHFSSLLCMMEEAEHAFLRAKGLSVFSQSNGRTISWPRVNVHCDFHSPARFEDEIDIAVTIAELASKAVTYSFHLSIGDRKVATGSFTAVCCLVERVGEEKRLKSTQIPPDIVAKFKDES